MDWNVSRVNIRQPNGLGRVHAAKPQMKVTYRGRPVNEEDWLIASKEANCTGCARAGAPRRTQGTEDARRRSSTERGNATSYAGTIEARRRRRETLP